MNIPQRYRKPVLFAVLLHVVLLCVLIINFAPSVFHMPASSAPMPTIQAKAVTQSAVQAEIDKIDQQRQAVREEKIQQQEKIVQHQKLVEHEKVVHQEQIQKQIEVAKEQKVEQAEKMEQQKLAAVAAAKQAVILKQEAVAKAAAAKAAAAKAAAAKKLLAQKALKLAAKKLQTEKAVAALKAQTAKEIAQKAAKNAKAKALLAEQKKLQQQMMQQQIMSEQKNISTVLSQAQQGAVDKYKAEILSLIQSNWRIDQVNSKLKCVYDVSVAPDGSVLSITLAQSSGNTNLDESAKQAIEASSPLPVPKDLAVFNHFRQLVLTLSPQGYLQSVTNS